MAEKKWQTIPNFIGQSHISDDQLDEAMDALANFGEEGYVPGSYGRDYAYVYYFDDAYECIVKCHECDCYFDLDRLGACTECQYLYQTYRHKMPHKVFKKHQYD